MTGALESTITILPDPNDAYDVGQRSDTEFWERVESGETANENCNNQSDEDALDETTANG